VTLKVLGAENGTQKDIEKGNGDQHLLELVMPQTKRKMVTTASYDLEGSWS